ncbi:hypothetical protein SLE2022_323060 [Rubroshorea leprosula]
MMKQAMTCLHDCASVLILFTAAIGVTACAATPTPTVLVGLAHHANMGTQAFHCSIHHNKTLREVELETVAVLVLGSPLPHFSSLAPSTPLVRVSIRAL